MTPEAKFLFDSGKADLPANAADSDRQARGSREGRHSASS